MRGGSQKAHLQLLSKGIPGSRGPGAPLPESPGPGLGNQPSLRACSPWQALLCPSRRLPGSRLSGLVSVPSAGGSAKRTPVGGHAQEVTQQGGDSRDLSLIPADRPRHLTHGRAGWGPGRALARWSRDAAGLVCSLAALLLQEQKGPPRPLSPGPRRV